MQHNGHRKPAGARVAKDQLCLLRCDHAIDVADLILRKPAYPNPAKPRSIIAQVERPPNTVYPDNQEVASSVSGVPAERYRRIYRKQLGPNLWLPAQWM
jgi:hypothetical protein